MIGRSLGILLAAIACWATPLAELRAGSAEISGVRVGFADRYKVGLFTPVVLALRGGDAPMDVHLAVTVPDGDGVPTRFVTDPAVACRVETGGEAQVRLYVRFGRVRSTLRAELIADGKPVASRVFSTGEKADEGHFLPALEGQPLLVVLGDAAAGIEEAVDLHRAEADRRPVVVRLDSVRSLPERWYGYEGVDAMIVSTSSAAVFSPHAAVKTVIPGVRQWVEQGGRLLICGGAGAGELLSEGRPLAGLLPGKFLNEVAIKQTGSLESFCRSSSPVPKSSVAAMKVVRLGEVDGQTEVQEGDLPLVVKGSLGFGQTVFFAAALDRGPIANWQDRALLAARLLDLPTRRADDAGEGTSVMHYGYSDLAGQLRSALDRFEGVGAAPFWLVGGLILVYIALIGPLDYWFLTTFGRRMGLTWLTFPLTVAGFCILAVVLTRSLRGDAVRIHQVDVIDLDLAAAKVRGTAWFNVYSPHTAAFDLTLRPRLPDGQEAPRSESLLAWLGLPGDALGGMNPKAADPSPWAEGYAFSPTLDAMSGVPIAAGATKSFTARWSAPAKCPIDAELTLLDDAPNGTIINGSGQPLVHCLLAYRHWVYELGDLEPGQATTLGPMTRRSELRTLLTGRKMVGGDDKGSGTQVAERYDHESEDPAYILRIMSFFEAAGGQRYTGLSNDYQRFVDLTPLLTAGRAVFFAVGRPGPEAAARRSEVLYGGKPLGDAAVDAALIFRAVIPVGDPKGVQASSVPLFVPTDL